MTTYYGVIFCDVCILNLAPQLNIITKMLKFLLQQLIHIDWSRKNTSVASNCLHEHSDVA